jgi:hypothetical protein
MLASVVAIFAFSAVACGGGSGVTGSGVTVARTAVNPSNAWLGLNYNADVDNKQLRAFSVRGVIYDREGNIEVRAGETLQSSFDFRWGLARTYGAGMVPDFEIDTAVGPPGCTTNPSARSLCLPRGQEQIDDFVRGFVATATSVMTAYPHRRALFEPMDEPWNWAWPAGTVAGSVAAGEYAAVLAPLLTAAKKAGIPLTDIYVPALGVLPDGTNWISDLYEAQPCLQPGPASCGPIGGWNVHPYGQPGSSSGGIGSVPGLRTEMRSGEDNVIVSEVGFCATTVDGGAGCDENTPTVVGSGSETATWLTETLDQAVPMHKAKWLKALIVWARSDGGWAMQNANGSLTPQGQALMRFAVSPLSR